MDNRPAHCGVCDPMTRMLALNGDLTLMARCPDCHPLVARQSQSNRRGERISQFRRCQGCNQTIYSWDQTPCGSHTSSDPGRDRRPSAGRIREILSLGGHTTPLPGGPDMRLKDP